MADSVSSGDGGIGDGGATGLFDGEERLKALSAAGDPLERLTDLTLGATLAGVVGN